MSRTRRTAQWVASDRRGRCGSRGGFKFAPPPAHRDRRRRGGLRRRSRYRDATSPPHCLSVVMAGMRCGYVLHGLAGKPLLEPAGLGRPAARTSLVSFFTIMMRPA